MVWNGCDSKSAAVKKYLHDQRNALKKVWLGSLWLPSQAFLSFVIVITISIIWNRIYRLLDFMCVFWRRRRKADV